MNIPNDPFILFSWINTQLRDSGMTFEAFCAEHEIDAEAMLQRLADAGFRYDESTRRFR